jgi:hypothetical protein
MEPRLDRADRDPKGRRDVGQRHPQEVVQDNDRALSFVEVPKHPFDDIAIGESAGRVGDGRVMVKRDLDFDRTPSPAPRLIQAGVDRESMEPGVEPIGLTQPGQIPPGSEECVLDSVACELRVPEDQSSGLVQPHDSSASELGEGVVIASLGPLHEQSLVHGRLACGDDR